MLTKEKHVNEVQNMEVQNMEVQNMEVQNMEVQNIKEEVRRHILMEFLPGESPSNLRDDTPLRTSGVLDSMATLQLVTFVEEGFGIEVEAREASVENFDSLNQIAAFIQQKKCVKKG